MSSALYDAIQPALAHCDAAIDSVFASQAGLASQIDTLAALLSSFNALHRSSAALFAPYTAKLQAAKKRVKRLQSSVERINGRLDDMRDTVRRKEGLGGYSAVGGAATRLSLSSIASMAQQALAVGSGVGGGAAGASGAESRAGAKAEDEAREDESVAAQAGELDSVEALVPVLDKSAANTTYGSLPASAPSPTSASPRHTSEGGEATNGAVAADGAATPLGSARGSVAAPPSASASHSSAPSSTALLQDLLAWDG